MSSPQKKQSQYFIAAQFTKVRLTIPTYKKIKHIYQYLSKEKNNPFKSFFITNKLKERPQFNEEREIKEIKEEFKRDKQGNYVILCYEDKTRSNAEPNPNPKEPKDAKEEKEEKEKDGGCLIM